MKKIGNICRQHHIQLIEDCAMALGSEFDGKPLGSFGNLAALSFHETKNIHCGEGGALLVNDSTLLEAAEILINCGTNRSQFEQGKTDHYSWTAKSGNFQLSELQAAFLYPQLLERKKITETRLVLWNRYQQNLSAFLPKEKLPVVTENCRHNAHLFYLLLDSARQRKEMIRFLQEAGIETVFHYIPLHNAPLWKSPNAALPVTEDVAARILRLPLYYELRCEEVDYLCSQIREFLM